MEKQIRTGKMHAQATPNKQGLSPSYIQRPWLNLTGKWLHNAGFHVGQPIVITVRKNRLVITKVKTQKNEKHQQLKRKKNVQNKVYEPESI
jgi:toxic protein SymE